MEAAAQPQLETPRTRPLRLLFWLFILLAAAEFSLRGPSRYLPGPGNWNDLSQNYAASKLWLRGESPADPKNFVELWRWEGHSRLDLDDIRTHLTPLPGALVVLAPIAVLPWNIAKTVWLVILLASFAATVWALAKAAGYRWSELRTLAFIAACLALAPFQTGIASGNTSILVIGLCALAIWAAHADRDGTSGILFGIACAVKPQLGAFLVLYYLLRRRWKLFGTAVAVTSVLTLIGVLYLQMRAPSWVQDYVHNARGFVTSNHIDDFTTANPSRFTLINLQVPFFSITGSAKAANLLAFAIVGVLVCVWFYRESRTDEGTPEFLSLAAISALALLPVYHRFYDAALLAVPLCWCVAHVTGPSKAIARASLLCMIPFLAPGAALLEQLSARGRVPTSVVHSKIWDTFLMPHETWALLLLFFVLLYGMSLHRSQENVEATQTKA